MRIVLLAGLLCFIVVASLCAQQEREFDVPWLKVGNEHYPPYSPEKPYTGWMSRYFKWGPFWVHAGTSARVKYCDNIYYSPSSIEPVSDAIFAAELALRADLVRYSKYYLLLGLNARRNEYLSYSGLSNNEFLFKANTKFWVGRNLDFGCSINFTQEVEPVSILYADRYGRTRLNFLAFSDWKTPVEKLKMRFELQGENTNFWREVFSNLDHNEVYFNTLISYLFRPKLTLTGRLGGGFLTYTDSWLNDFSYVVFYAGGRGELSPKTRYVGELGLYVQSVSVSNSAAQDEYTGPVWRGSFEWQATGKMLFCLEVLRWIEWHAAANYQVVDSFGSRVRWVMTKRIYVEGNFRFELANPASQGGYLTRFAWRFAGNAGAYYRLKHFLYLGVGLEYVRRLSHIPLASYHVTTVYLHCTVAF